MRCRYDQVAVFKWSALFKLFQRALSTGKLNLPESAMEGTYTLTLDSDSMVTAIKEDVWLVPLFKSSRVKNRRIARDMLLWQEVKQPAGTEYIDWDDRVMTTLCIEDVPGMGQFDIDGLEEGQGSQYTSDAAIVLGFLVVIVLSFGAAYGIVSYDNRALPQTTDAYETFF
jgi:hypothetical protein